MKLTVLIATYNRKTLLEQCLLHLIDKAQELPDEVVIVVGGRDGSDEIVRKYQGRYPFLKLVEVENKSLGDSQNRGLPYCSGDIVATLDDDAFVFPDWAKMVKLAHEEHPEAGCIGGRIINLYPNNLIARLESHIGMPYDKQEGFYTRTVAGVSCTYKREAMGKVGLFDETLPAGMDSDYNWRVLKAGYKVWFDPRIKMHHRNRTNLKDFLKQQTWYGRGYYLVRKKNPDLYSAFPRDLNRWQDWLKLAWFVPGILSNAILQGMKANSLLDKIAFLNLLMLKEIWWRYGWVKQWIGAQR
jgi:GT2 family glycosyltransferase